MTPLINKILQIIFTRIARHKVESFGRYFFVNGYSVFSNHTCVGNNCHFNGVKILGKGSVVIEDNFHSAPGLLILTSYHDFTEGILPYGEKIISKNITIEKNVWIGRNVILLGGITIGEGSIIQAGSVVSKSIPPLAIAGGNPAMPYKYRDLENYNSRL